MAARVSRRNPTHRLHARKAYHQELLRSRAVTNSPLKWSATSYARMVGSPYNSSLYQNRGSLRTCFRKKELVTFLKCSKLSSSATEDDLTVA